MSASINKSELVLRLETFINTSYTTGSFVVDDVVALALSVSSLSEKSIIVVSSIDALPNLFLYDSPNGMIYFVDDLNVFAVSSNSKWLTLDGRLLRQDISFSLALSWGYNTGTGQLGDNTAVTKSSPVAVVGGFTDWCQVSGGNFHSLGVRTNGTAWAWGNGSSGKLGDNTTTNRSSPVLVAGGFTDWCQVSAGDSHSLGVRTNGTAWAWGFNGTGQLGDNTIISKQSPVSVVGGFTDWCQVSGGTRHSLGVRTNGTAWAWGCNVFGKLGDNSTVSKSSPVSVVGGFTNWCQVSASVGHSLGLRTNGTLWAWGLNNLGQLGDNSAVSKISPVSVVGGFTNWCQVSAGANHSLGVRTNGSAWAWGTNGFGHLGDNTTVNKSSPVSVVGGFTDWCQVSASTNHNLGLRTNGTLWAWGINSNCQLGDNTSTNRSSPVSVVGGFTDWYQVSAGSGNHSTGLRSVC